MRRLAGGFSQHQYRVSLLYSSNGVILADDSSKRISLLRSACGISRDQGQEFPESSLAVIGYQVNVLAASTRMVVVGGCGHLFQQRTASHGNIDFVKETPVMPPAKR